MAEELRLAFILLGSLAIGAVILHGVWTVRKTVSEERKLKQVEEETPTEQDTEQEQQEQQFKLKQMEMDFAQLEQAQNSEKETGLPVANVDVDSIYDEKSTESSPASQETPEQESDSVAATEESPENAAFTPKNELFPELSHEGTGPAEQPKQQQVQAEIIEQPEPQLEPEIGNFSALDNDDEAAVELTVQSDEDETSAKGQREETQDAPQEVLMLFVDKSEGSPIEGAKLLPVLLTLGFKFGEMDFFHRHEHNSGQGEVLFSLANMYNPGTFDVDNMEQMSTRGLTIFMTLPNAGEPLQTFNMMHNAAKKIADEFGAKVLDDKRRPLDVGIVRSYVEKIRKF